MLLHILSVLCILLSGFASLGYELVWIKMLSLSMGSTAHSFSTVLAVFFGGLALGSWLGSKLSHRITRPLQFYIYIEIAMAVMGILLHFVIRQIGDVFAAIDPGVTLSGYALRLLVIAPVLLAPTVLMGMTLPVLAKTQIFRNLSLGVGTSYLYGINTLGSFLGVFITTVLLFRVFGLLGTNLLLGSLNLLAALGAWGLTRLTPDLAVDGRQAVSGELTPPAAPLRLKILLIAALSGFTFITFEIVWAKMFANFLGGGIYAVSTVLMSALLGIGLGSLAASWFFRKSYDLTKVLISMIFITVSAAVLIVLQMKPINYLLGMLGEWPGDLVPVIFYQMGFVFLLLLPACCASGASFPVLLHILERDRNHVNVSLGPVFAVNTIGSILASLLFGFFIIPYLGSEFAVFAGLCSLLLMLLLTLSLKPLKKISSVSFVMSAAATLLVLQFPGFDRQFLNTIASTEGLSYQGYALSLAKKMKNIVYFSEGKSSSITVSRTGNSFGLSSNGLGQGGHSLLPPHHILESLLVAYMPMIHAEKADNGLVIGLGMGVTVDALVQLGVKKVTVVELEEKVIDAVAKVRSENSPLQQANVTLEINDARQFLNVHKKKGRPGYDLITSMPAHPWVASAIFTKEFFAIARDNLSENGVFSTWFGLAGDQELNHALLGAFTSVFPNYVLYDIPETGAYFLVGSKSAMRFSPERIASFASHPSLHSFESWADPAFVLGKVLIGQNNASALHDLANTDDNMFIEMNYPLHRSGLKQNAQLYGGLSIARPMLASDFMTEKDYVFYYSQTLDRMLGMTRDGFYQEYVPDPLVQKAKNIYELLKPQLSSEAQAYFASLILWREDKIPDAIELMQQHGDIAQSLDLRAQDLYGMLKMRLIEPLSPESMVNNGGRNSLEYFSRFYVKELAHLDDANSGEGSWNQLVFFHNLMLPSTGFPEIPADQLSRWRTEVVPWVLRSGLLGLNEIALQVSRSMGVEETSLLLSEQNQILRQGLRDFTARPRIPRTEKTAEAKPSDPLMPYTAAELAKNDASLNINELNLHVPGFENDNREPKQKIANYRQAARYSPLAFGQQTDFYLLALNHQPELVPDIETTLLERGQTKEWIRSFREKCCPSKLATTGSATSH